MVRAEFRDGFSPYIKGLHAGISDLRSLAKPIGQVMLYGNRQGLGTDLNGNTLVPLAASTWKRRKGTGPPLAPMSQAPRIVTNAKVRTNGGRVGDYLAVELYWTLPWLRFHESGTKWMPQSDIVGIRPATMDQIQGIVDTHFGNLVTARAGTK